MEVCKKVRYQKPGDEETMNLIRRTLFLGLQAVAVVAVLGLASYLAEPGLIVASPEERAERIGSLIRQMGSDSLQERERASDELVRIGARPWKPFGGRKRILTSNWLAGLRSVFGRSKGILKLLL